MGFAFAHHFATYDAVEALTHYRKRFKRRAGGNAARHSGGRHRRAETDAEAEKLATSMDLNRLRRDRGQYLPLPSVEEALAYPLRDAERASIARKPLALFVGSPRRSCKSCEPMISASRRTN
jgi:alkanesulfonate monooxygenase SsuD/methylene tetrahydromethanopterin reductase-like flavin-dependent oxidoreductase (luciferase family)